MKPYRNTVLILSCFAALLWACDAGQRAETTQGGGSTGKKGKPAPEAAYIPVRAQRIALTSRLPGRVKAYRTAEIRPQVGGIIQSRLFKEGGFVDKGQQLYQIDPARYEADYQSAKANLQEARAKLTSASALVDRYKSLIGARAVSEQAYDEATAEAEQSRAAVALAEASVRSAKINLDYTRVYAPISGYIGPSSVTEGALVTAQQPTALATIRQLDPVYVDLSQSAAEAQQIQERIISDRLAGREKSEYKAVLLLGNTGKTYPHAGRLDATDLAVDPQTGTIRLRVVVPNPDTILLPGMFVRASLEMAEESEAVVLPQKSVFIEPDGSTSVWVINPNDKAQKRSVRTGALFENKWVILDGLDAGDRVIVQGTMNLREGAAVTPVKSKDSSVSGVQEIPPGTLADRTTPPDDGWQNPGGRQSGGQGPAPEASTETDGRAESGVE